MADKMSREVSAELHAGEKVMPSVALKVDIDVSDALTGLKAVQREAKKATQALREVEEQARRNALLPGVPRSFTATFRSRETDEVIAELPGELRMGDV